MTPRPAGDRVLVVRLDSLGDVVVCGPAVRAVAAGAGHVTVLAGPRGAEAARLLPGVDEVGVFGAPWISPDGRPVDAAAVTALIDQVRGHFDAALVLTSFHQSALPTALLLRLAGVPWIAAVSTDFPGTLLDVRLPEPPDAPENQRMLAIAAGAGWPLPPGDDGALRLRPDLTVVGGLPERYVAVHPGADAPARAYPAELWAQVVAALAGEGMPVVVTGSAAERALTASVAGSAALDLGGRLDVARLAAVIAGADAIAVGNTGPAHLAAAVGTPVVSLFSPVVPLIRWAPHTAARIVLGDQTASCAGSRARLCPIPGHPCLTGVQPTEVAAAVRSLVGVAA
jgi:ADP-heptose:LPS heptosyltransferase